MIHLITSYLNKSDLALTDVTVVVFDVDLSIVLDPARPAEKVVDAGCHMFPFIVVSKSKRDWKCETFSWGHIYFASQSAQSQRQQTHFRKCTLVEPIGKISIDFPQNLFLHLKSAKDTMKEDHLTLSYPSIPTQLCQFVYLITLPEDVVFSLCMASRDWRVVADLWSEGWQSDALRVLCMIMWLWLIYIPVLPQTESLYQACRIHMFLLERGWKAFLRFCNSWNCRSTPQMWQCIPNQTEGVTTIKVWGTRILSKHFWYSQYFYRSFPGPKHIGHLYLYPTPL